MSLSLQTLYSSQQQQNGNALQYVSTELQKDLKIRTVATVRKNGQALKDVPEEMKEDREVCLAAVEQNWQALQHVSREMKRDPGFVLAAVQAMKKDNPFHDANFWLSQYGILEEVRNRVTYLV